MPMTIPVLVEDPVAPLVDEVMMPVLEELVAPPAPDVDDVEPALVLLEEPVLPPVEELALVEAVEAMHPPMSSHLPVPPPQIVPSGWGISTQPLAVQTFI